MIHAIEISCALITQRGETGDESGLRNKLQAKTNRETNGKMPHQDEMEQMKDTRDKRYLTIPAKIIQRKKESTLK